MSPAVKLVNDFKKSELRVGAGCRPGWGTPMKLSRTIVALLVLAWVLFAGWLEWRQYHQRTHALILEKTAEGKTAALDLSRRIEKTLQFYHGVPLMLAQEPLVQAALSDVDCRENSALTNAAASATNAPCDTALDNLNTLLHRVQQTLRPDLDWVMDTNGLCVASSDHGQTNSGIGDNYGDREYFRQARQRGQGQQYAMGRRVHTPGLFFAARVKQNGRFIGEVAIKLNLDHLSDCLDLTNAFLTDGYGVIILANNPRLVMETLPNATVRLLSDTARQQRYQLLQFTNVALTPWHDAAATNLVSFDHEEPPQLMFSRPVMREGLRVYIPEALPGLLTLTRECFERFALIATAGASLIFLLGASLNYNRRQHQTNLRLLNQTGLLMDAERIARLGSWTCELPSGRLQLSEQAAEILQVPPRHEAGTHDRFAELALPADRDRVRQAVQNVLDTGEPCDLEYGLTRPDDGRTIIHLQGRLLKKSSGQPLRLVGTVQDITARKRVENEAIQNVSLLQATLESTTDGILVVDRNGKITSYNERFVKLWQIPRDVLATGQDQRLLQTVLGQLRDPDAFLAKVKDLYANPLAESSDLLEFTDGRVFERFSKPQVIAGQPVGRVWSFFDVTERRRAAATVIETERRLRIVIEATTDVIFLKDDAGRWQLINHAAERLFALPQVEYQGKTDLELAALLPARQKELTCCAQSDQVAWANRQPTRSEEFITQEDGLVHCFDIIKVPIFNPDGTRQSLVVVGRDITERKRTEQELFQSRETLRTVLNNIPQQVYWKNRDLVYAGCNLAMARDLGLDNPNAVIGKTDLELTNATDAEKYRELDRQVMATDQPVLNAEITENRADGRLIYLLVNQLPLHDQSGQVVGVLGTRDDITSRRILEDQFRQAQKMEAIGRLAGGIAHDFNNLLTVICGYSEILLHELPPDDSSRDALTEIRKAGDRAAALTRKLLAFSRKQVLEPDVLDLNALVGDCENMFRRLLGEDIRLTITLAPDLGKIKADPSQIDQVLLNLVVNARDAMPRGGELAIATDRAVLTEADRLQNADVKPGPYVCLSVGDTGCGMDNLTILHIFEPFFTTKEQGKGTGLGLAMIFGFIKQSGGHISVASEVGQGSVFRIYLPELPESFA